MRVRGTMRAALKYIWILLMGLYAIEAYAESDITFETRDRRFGSIRITRQSTASCANSQQKGVQISPSLILGCAATVESHLVYAYVTKEGIAYDLTVETGQNYTDQLDLLNTRNIYFFAEDHFVKTEPDQYVNLIFPLEAEPFLQNITYTIAANKKSLEDYLRKEVMSVSVGIPKKDHYGKNEKPIPPTVFYPDPTNIKDGTLGIRIVDVNTKDHRVILAVTRVRPRPTTDNPLRIKDVAMLAFIETPTTATTLMQARDLPRYEAYDITKDDVTGLMYEIKNDTFDDGINIMQLDQFLGQSIDQFVSADGISFSAYYQQLWDFMYNPKRVVIFPTSEVDPAM
jgi:hypothetical protein